VPQNGSRDFPEGTSVELVLRAPHSCRDEQNRYHPTTSIMALFPNGHQLVITPSGGQPVDYLVGDQGLVDYLQTADRDGNLYSGNLVMGIKPAARALAAFSMLHTIPGPVPPFYSHGLHDRDTRAIHWMGGSIPNDWYVDLPFRVRLPKINPQSCIRKITVAIPSVQECEGGYKLAWIGTDRSGRYAPGSDPKVKVYTDYSATFTIVRDLAKNPLPPSCGQGIEVKVAPPASEIDHFLHHGVHGGI